MEVARMLRPITLAEGRLSYETLKSAPCVNKLDLGRAGNPALDYFFLHHRLKVKTKRHISFLDALHDPRIKAQLTDLVGQYKKINPSTLSSQELLRQQYSVFQLYYGTINQFRPIVAKFIYCQLKPQTAVLDFSAGWGGRCMGAMSMGIPYIGIDANTKLRPAYERMIRTLEPTANVQMFFQPSETFDFSKHNYDLVFTSPPYFRIEEYEKMPEYGSKQGFLDKFFIPVVKESWKHLQVGGHMALNMPAEMYEGVRTYLPKLTRTYTLPLQNRNPVSAVKQIALQNAPRSELIYVWRKNGRNQHTRKLTRK